MLLREWVSPIHWCHQVWRNRNRKVIPSIQAQEKASDKYPVRMHSWKGSEWSVLSGLYRSTSPSNSQQRQKEWESPEKVAYGVSQSFSPSCPSTILRQALH